MSSLIPASLNHFWHQRVLPLWERLVAPHPALTEFSEQLRARVLAVLALSMLAVYFIPEGIRLLVSTPSSASRTYILITTLSVLLAYALSRTRHPLIGAWVLLLPLTIGPAVGLLSQPEITEITLYYNVSWGIVALIIGALLLPPGHFVALFLIGLGALVGAVHYHGLPLAWATHPVVIFSLISFIMLSIIGTRKRFLHRIAESEQRFRDLFNSTLEALVIHDGKRILAVNPAFERVFRCKAEEAIGKPPLDFVALDQRKAALQTFISTRAQPGTLIRNVARRPDGTEFIAEAISSPVTYQGQPAFALSLRDVTRRVEAERALERERNFLQTILESPHDPFYVIDVHTYQIVLANSAAREKGAPGAATCYALSHRRDTPCSGAEHPCPLQQILRTNEPYTVEHIHYHADGTPYYVEVHGYPIHDENGQVVQMVEYAVDITDRKQAEAEIRKLQQAMDQSANAVVITNHEGTIEYVNPAFTRMTGYSAEEAIGQTPRILKSGYHPPEFYQQMWETLIQGQTWQGEILNKRKDGSLYWERETISPVLDEQGQIAHFIAIKEDITAQKATEEEIRKLQQAVEQSANAIVITNKQGIIEYVNPAFTQLTGYTYEEAIGRNPRILKSGQHPKSFYTELWRTILRGEVWRNEIINKRKDDTLYWERMTITPVMNADGEITHFVAIKEDITERKRLEEALRQARDRAEEASRLKTQLIGNVSHDMRTPLGGILGFTEMLLDQALGPITEKQRKALGHILSSTQTLLDFINDLIHQAELESGQLRLKPRPFTAAELLKVVPTYAGLARSKGIRLHTEVDKALPEPLYGDLYWIRRLIGNLLSNAIKFTDEGHIWIRLLRYDEERWAIQVEDTGVGIPPDKQKIIFEPFSHVDDSPTRRHQGSGLGLSIVAQLVELMHGEIQLESTPGQGSTFTIILPCQQHLDEEKPA